MTIGYGGGGGGGGAVGCALASSVRGVVAQASGGGGDGLTADDYQTIIIWSLVMVALLIVGLVVVMWLKKRIKTDEEPAAVNPAGFTLADLRQLHKTGQMSNEEFERAKARIINKAQQAAQRDAAAVAAASSGGNSRSDEDLRKARERAELRRRAGQRPADPPRGDAAGGTVNDDADDGPGAGGVGL